MTLLSAEAHHLLAKRSRQGQRGFDIAATALLSTLAFAFNFIALGFELRYESFYAAVLFGPGISLLFFLNLSGVAFTRYRRRRPIRGFLAILIGTTVASLAGIAAAGKEYWEYAGQFFAYKEMASYVNVDPSVEVGQSFMDAGVVYFRDGTSVLRNSAIAFHNSDTYCVAPIVRQASATDAGSNPSGTVDWWAVGTNCCGENGNSFTCAEAGSNMARSGLRLLTERDRSMYLLAVQQWSASSDIPALHPLFFEWVSDPIVEIQRHMETGWDVFWLSLFTFVLFSIIGSFLLVYALAKVY